MKRLNCAGFLLGMSTIIAAGSLASCASTPGHPWINTDIRIEPNGQMRAPVRPPNPIAIFRDTARGDVRYEYILRVGDDKNRDLPSPPPEIFSYFNVQGSNTFHRAEGPVVLEKGGKTLLITYKFGYPADTSYSLIVDGVIGDRNLVLKQSQRLILRR